MANKAYVRSGGTWVEIGATSAVIQDATTTQKGQVQLTDSTSSTSTTTAATPSSVKSAYDLANGAIQKSIVDAKGDLVVATAADTVARLAVGPSNGQVLTVDSTTATGVAWKASTVINYQEFTSSGTWTKPANAIEIKVEVIGGGQGGAASAAAAGTSSTKSGGEGGNGGGYAAAIFEADVVPSTVTVTVGSGGLGQTATAGGDGAAGGESSFGNTQFFKVPARGGGQTSPPPYIQTPYDRSGTVNLSRLIGRRATNNASIDSGFNSGAGGTSGDAAMPAELGGAGGGRGGSTNSSNTYTAAGNGGKRFGYHAAAVHIGLSDTSINPFTGIGSGIGGSFPSGVGGDATAGSGDGGGGGGGTTATGRGGKGGNGAVPGGGGGGGGCCTTTISAPNFSSGGNGASGRVRVWAICIVP
jgi:hypothetical protein